MKIFDFLKTDIGRKFTSIIIALGLASMLRMACKNANLIIVKGPPLSQTEDKIFSFDKKCYSYKTVTTSCKNLENNKKD